METRPEPAAWRASTPPLLPPEPPAPPPSSSRESAAGGAGWPGALVFAGSAEQDVALAKSFWSAVTLQPPLESRLEPRAEPRDSAALSASSALLGSPSSALRRSHLLLDKGSFLSQGSFIEKKEENTEKALEPDHSDERKKYFEKAKRREDILALLRKRREERIAKEVVFQPYKPKTKPQESKVKVSEPDLEDQESVKALT